MQRNGSTRTPRIGLVLGGGGILGGAWLVGALHALAEAADWNPTSADYIVGTSAGSVVAAMTAEGVPPWFLVHHQRGGVGRWDDGPVRRAAPARGRGVPPVHHVERTDPASRARLPAARAVQRVAAVEVPAVRGDVRVDRTRVPRRPTRSDGSSGRSSSNGWSSHPNLWIVALDYKTGHRACSAGRAPRVRTSTKRCKRRARSPACTVRCASTDVCTSTAACGRRRTSTCSRTTTSTWTS